MALWNLANPVWMMVDCKSKVMDDVFCHINAIRKTPEKTKPPDTQVCSRNGIQIDNNCYFLKVHTTAKGNESTKAECGMQQSTNCQTVEGHLQVLVEATDTPFPPILLCQWKIFLHFRTFVFVIVKSNSTSTTFPLSFLLSSSGVKNQTIGNNLFRNPDKSYSSVRHLLTDIYDDKGKYSGPGNKGKNLSHVAKTFSCSDLFFTSSWGSCQVFFLQANNNNIINEDISSQFKEIGTNLKCFTQNMIPCGDTTNICMEIPQICSFVLKNSSELSPCPQGQHLRSCEHFECNVNMKCPHSYCVSWAYVCDGKWDCPDGADEHQSCRQPRLCEHLFRCKDSRLCVHPAETCDGIKNCPLADDEDLCSLANVTCPNFCECLTFALVCRSHFMPKAFATMFCPYFAVTFDSFVFSMVVDEIFDCKISRIGILKMISSGLREACINFPQLNSLFLLDMSSNKIRGLKSKCFKQGKVLKVLGLNNNLISKVASDTFYKLPSLLLLNLSYNHLSDLSFTKPFSAKLKILSLTNNSLQKLKLSQNQPLQVLETDNFRICCIVQAETKCSTRIPGYFSCSGVLSDNGAKVVAHILIIFVVTCCTASLYFLTKGTEKGSSKTFSCTATSLNFCHICYVMSLFILSAADFSLADTFALQEMIWRSSPACFVTFELILLYSIMEPSVLCLLSISRLMIVIYPISTRLKNVKFVIRLIFCIFSCSTVLSVSATVLTFVELGSSGVPTLFCSPFLDPLGNVTVIKVLILLVGPLHMCAIIGVIICSIGLVIVLRASVKNMKASKSATQSNHVIIIQLAIMTGSMILSWVPPDAIFFAAMFLAHFHLNLFLWIHVLLIPLGSITDPIVLLVTSIRKLLGSSKSSAESREMPSSRDESRKKPPFQCESSTPKLS